MGIFKADEIKKAKKRRAKLLQEFNKLGWSKRRFAIKHGVTPTRMGQILRKAMIEFYECDD